MNNDHKKIVLRMIPYGIYVLTADDGKGGVVAATVKEAENALDMIFGGAFGAAGASVVVEEFLEGEVDTTETDSEEVVSNNEDASEE